ncbi:TetR/AcrR family transcriptional regulator [Nocardioides marmoriginsengisoli]|uniref:TetR/AcrR family transcriptional regulator n=1 Tax=Nocardioides marmoriginsengisoli TaxID=661483 RepID=UPI001608A24A|nr:TetR/AcrR family transcriptional regulator [Nocardioides marmoriginsengisoli]
MTDNQRRRGPRVDVDVPTVLLNTAEELFGTHGVDNVSLRAIAREAGVAPAALTHHFPTKRDLLDSVVWRRGDRVAEDVRGRLRALGGRADVSTRELVEAVLFPFVDEVNRDPADAVRWLRIVITLALSGDEIIASGVAGEGDITDLFTSAATGVPALQANSVELRAPIAMFSMLTALAAADLGGYGRPIGPAGLDPEYVEQLALFTSSGLQAG